MAWSLLMPRAGLLHLREPAPDRMRGVMLDDFAARQCGPRRNVLPLGTRSTEPAFATRTLPFQSIITLVAHLGIDRRLGTLAACHRTARLPPAISRLAAQTGASMVYTVLGWSFVAFVVLIVIGLIWLALLNQRDEARSKKAAAQAASSRGNSA
jgi:hypothetical protein